MKGLREHRLERLESIEALAKAAGVSTKTVSDVELGKVRPKLRTIRRLTEALGVSAGDVAEFAAVIRRGATGDDSGPSHGETGGTEAGDEAR